MHRTARLLLWWIVGVVVVVPLVVVTIGPALIDLMK
jgi:hypothetical protein